MNAADLGFQLHGTALRLTTRPPDAPGPGPLASSSSRAVGMRQAYYVPAGSYPKNVAAAASFPCKGFGPPLGPPRPAPARAPAPRFQPSTRTPYAGASARPSTARPRTAATTAAPRRHPRDDSALVPARSHPSHTTPRDGSGPAVIPTAWGSTPRLAEATVPSGDAGPPAAPSPPASRLSDSMTRLVLEDASPSPSPLPPEPLDFRGAPAPSPPVIAPNPAALSSLPTPPLSPQPPDLVHASSSSLHQELRPEPDGDAASRSRRPISARVPPARTKTASTSTSGVPSTRPPASRYYDHKSVKRQTCRKNTEQWAMETIVIRRLRYLVDHLDELGEEHLPLLNTLEASGIRPDQLQLYFPHVRTVHDLKVHLVNLLSDRDPDHVRPHRTVARSLAGSDRPPGPPAAPPVGVTAGPSRRNHGHTKPASTPLEVLKIVEQFYPIPRSAANAAAAKSAAGSDGRLGLATATTGVGASVGGLGAATSTGVCGLHGGMAAARHRLAG
ncbi:hypothetical protein AMAG_11652 [Allomyces macrogynus ATCC 38327]|uniref:Uncharacterized protein n=1 Tax=Allomyces macrogynus (strain ATCC 38327) TaxID=578462 RepID=A0A0L0SW16_ALLM3|nr:hypothetical protein AMAG_11652 [Allomyces macrogynus ATCC 38327]|eukprot:KNE66519.1 hypothetical protein AMAG_11652 [Allomyces macrogynus ATCC 38327]